MPKKAGRPARAKLTREQILRETILLLRQGDGDLSMRSLAAHLKVDPMAIYHYFSNRDALMHAAVEHVFAVLPASTNENTPWQDATLDFLMAYHAVALRNFRLTQYLVTHGELRIGPIDTFNSNLLNILQRAGLDSERTELMRDLLIDYLHGYLMAEVHFSPKEKKQRSQQIPVTLRWLLESLPE